MDWQDKVYKAVSWIRRQEKIYEETLEELEYKDTPFVLEKISREKMGIKYIQVHQK